MSDPGTREREREHGGGSPAAVGSVLAPVAALEAALGRERKKLDLVSKAAAALSSAPDLEQLLALLMDNVTQLMDADRATLYLRSEDGGELWSKVMHGGAVREIRLRVGEGIAGWVASSGEVVNIGDAYQDTRFQRSVDQRSGYRTRSILCVPMRDSQGAIVGVVQVLNKKGAHPDAEPLPFTGDDEELLLALAAQAAVAIDNSKLYLSLMAKNAELARATAMLEERQHELNVLYEVEKELSQAVDLEGLLGRILRRATELLHADAGTIALLTAGGDALELKTVQGPAAEQLRGERLALGQGLLGWTVAHRQPAIVNDAEGDTRHAAEFARDHGLRPSNLMAAPVFSGDTVVGGVEIIDKQGGEPFDEVDLKLLVLIAGQLGSAIELDRRRTERRDQDRLASIGRLMAGVLHDLKTPMTVISGYAQLMAACEDGAQRERYVESILRQFDIMSGMTREVLAFARGDRDLMIRKVYLHKFIDEVVTQLRTAFAGRPIEIEVDLGYDGAAMFDEQKFLRVLHNLARNAADAMPEGGHFRIATRLEGTELVIVAADDGPGIPPGIQARLFELFASDKAGGTGLGLAIVKQIVDDHGGTIRCDTGPGGTTFTIRIPHRMVRSGDFPVVR
ncbi:MAG TPA: GAF domain-containing protein [Kofleriaceae bacterium]|nr:GAF domain-containing protein [Kofleriaceae bacterium]